MSEHLTKPRVILPVTAFIIAAIAMLILSIAPSPPKAMARTEPVVDATSVEAMMRRIGATPEAMAAAALTSNQAGAVVGYLDAFLDTSIGDLADADAAVAAARADVQALERLARSGKASQQDLNDLATARTALTDANADLATLLTAAQNAAYTDLDSDQKAVLAAVQGACDQHPLGIAICAADRTEAQWHEIRRAAGAVRAATFNGEEPDPEALTILDDAAGHADTIEAQANIDVRLTGITAAVETALGNI